MSFLDLLRTNFQPNQSLIKGDDLNLNLSDLKRNVKLIAKDIPSNAVVALIGNFDSESIVNLLYLMDNKNIIVPLTAETSVLHQYFFESSGVEYVIEKNRVHRYVSSNSVVSPYILDCKESAEGGIVFFSSGTTGKPKGIIHRLDKFTFRFKTIRPSLKTVAFLKFDHIGGINTLLHTISNGGEIIHPATTDLNHVGNLCFKNQVEVLPTTPTYLRILLASDDSTRNLYKQVRIFTYGTELMDSFTLNKANDYYSNSEFRQTYGSSEVGILRVKSENSRSLFMSIGGEGVETKIMNSELYIKNKYAMLGYLDGSMAFDQDGWFKTKDLVEIKNNLIKILGRSDGIINVGGLKFNKSLVEDVALSFPGIVLCKVVAKNNPITGQHAELLIEASNNETFDVVSFRNFLKKELLEYMVPLRITLGGINLSHRYKMI